MEVDPALSPKSWVLSRELGQGHTLHPLPVPHGGAEDEGELVSLTGTQLVARPGLPFHKHTPILYRHTQPAPVLSQSCLPWPPET